jgi:hypothetical protein
MRGDRWVPRYNLGPNRAGGFKAPEGWYVGLLTDGEWYCFGQDNPKAKHVPFYDQAAAQAKADTLNRRKR